MMHHAIPNKNPNCSSIVIKHLNSNIATTHGPTPGLALS